MAVIIDHDHQCVLEVLENREKTTVLAYLRQAKEHGPLAHVEEVTTDMWDAYAEAAKEVFGETVAITIDRFHVMKNFQESLTAARARYRATGHGATRSCSVWSARSAISNPSWPTAPR